MITIDDPTFPRRSEGDWRAEVARRERRVRRHRRLAVAGIPMVAVATVLALLAVTFDRPGTVLDTGIAADGRHGDDPGAPGLPPGAEDRGDPNDPVRPPSAAEDPTVITAPSNPPLSGERPAPPPRGAPSGRLAFVRQGVLYEGLTDGSGVRPVDSRMPIREPAWSPDGKLLAFVYARELHVLDIDSRIDRTLAGREYSVAFPSWSPDGTSIVFTRTVVGAMGDLLQVRLDTGEIRTIGKGDAPSIGPDGRIAFQCNGNPAGFQVCLTDESGADLGVVPGTLNLAWPAWSPDGAWIAAIDQQPGGFSLVKFRPDGSQKTVVVDGVVDGSKPSWFPDGSRIAFDAEGEPDGLRSVAADGSAVRTMTTDARDHSPAVGRR